MATAVFFVNTANDAPSAPTVNYPADGSTVTVRTPQLSVNAAADADNDSLTYEFEVYSDSGLTHLVSIEEGAGPSWTMSAVLTDNTWYYWRSRAKDSHGATGDWTAATSFFVNNSGTNDPPAISVLAPGASEPVTYATSYEVRWSDSDPDSDAVITLGYDTDNAGCDGTTIAGSISENDPANSQSLGHLGPAVQYELLGLRRDLRRHDHGLLLCGRRPRPGRCKPADAFGRRQRHRQRAR